MCLFITSGYKLRCIVDEELSERVIRRESEEEFVMDEGDKDKLTASAKELFNRYKAS